MWLIFDKQSAQNSGYLDTAKLKQAHEKGVGSARFMNLKTEGEP